MPEAFCKKCKQVVASGPSKAGVDAAAKAHKKKDH